MTARDNWRRQWRNARLGAPTTLVAIDALAKRGLRDGLTYALSFAGSRVTYIPTYRNPTLFRMQQRADYVKPRAYTITLSYPVGMFDKLIIKLPEPHAARPWMKLRGRWER